MGVFTRKDSSYYWLRLDGYRDPNGNPVREPTRVKKDAPTPVQRKENRDLAEKIFHDRMHELAKEDASPPKPDAITFAAFLDWWETHKLPRRKGREREGYILPRLRRAFGSLNLTAIDRAAVDEYMTERLTTPTVITYRKRTRTVQVTEGTVNREVALLKSILQAAVPKYLAASPLFGMKTLRTTAPLRRTLTVDEEDRLLKALKKEDRAFVIMGLDTLCRLSDILNLTREDDHKTYLTIREPKDPTQSQSYTVPVSKRLRRALDAMPKAGPYYFAHRRHAKTPRDRRNGIRQMLEYACAKTDPPIPFGRANGGITFHWATRRTGASRMIANNVDPKTVQRIGHWATAELVLDIYSEAIDENARRAVEIPAKRARPRTRKKKRDPKRVSAVRKPR